MKNKTTFNITEDEVKEMVDELNYKKLSKKQIHNVLTFVECDEILWKQIKESIFCAIKSL